MNFDELYKKVELLERKVRVHLNLIDKQDRILDELVARIDVQCREDITHIEIKDEGMFQNFKRITLCSIGQCIDLTFSNNDTIDEVLQAINSKQGFKLTIDPKYRKLLVKMLPNNKRSNLHTNNCLIIIKL